MPLHTRHRVIEAVLNEILGLHNKPKAVVHSVHKLTGPKRKKKYDILISFLCTPTSAVYGVGMDSPGVGFRQGQNIEIGSEYKCLQQEADL